MAEPAGNSKEKAPGQDSAMRGLLLFLALLAVLQLFLLAAFTVLYVNFPTGYDAAYGLNHSAASVFRGLVSFPSLTLPPNMFQRAALATILGLWLCYFGGLILAERIQQGALRRHGLVIVATAGLVFNLALALAMPPVLSVDIYHYALHGRMASVYGLNPYAVTGNAVAGDPFWTLSPYRSITTDYGPTWTLLSAAVAGLTAGDVGSTVLGFKLLAVLANVASGLMVFLLAREITGGYGLVALLLYAWNPLILLETAGSGHNEAVMLLLALLGLWLVIKERPLAGGAFLALSIGVKYATLLLLPLAAAYLLAHSASRREGWQQVGKLIGVIAVVLVALAVSFAGSGSSIGQVLLPLEGSRNVMPNPLWMALNGSLESMGGQLPLGWRSETWLFLLLAFSLGLATMALAWAATTKRWPWSRLVFFWAILTFALYFIVQGGSFTWYFVIPLAAVVLPWTQERTHRTWAIMVALAIAAMLAFYAVPLLRSTSVTDSQFVSAASSRVDLSSRQSSKVRININRAIA